MKSSNLLILTSLIIVLLISSCELIFGPPQRNKLSREFILDYQVGDIFIFSTVDEAKIDTFEVTKFYNSYDDREDYEMVHVGFNNLPLSGRKFVVFDVTPDWIAFYYLSNPTLSINPDDDSYDVEINGIRYKDAYIYENDLQGNSDTLINKIQYHPQTGIISYRYENGDEYLLEKIIYVDD